MMRRRRMLACIASAGMAGCSDVSLEPGSGDTQTQPTAADSEESTDSLDEAMQDALETLGAPGGVIAVADKDGVVSERSYGWHSEEQATRTTTDSLFRIASLTKPFTAAAVAKLQQETDLTEETKVFEVLDMEPISEPEWIRNQKPDQRIYDITVAHLLNHRSGWLSEIDPVLESRTIAKELDLDHPATAEEIIQWLMRIPLQSDPGTTEAYFNTGYTILELLVEQISGQSFLSYLDSTVETAVAGKIDQAQSFPENRPAEEVEYRDHATCAQYDIISERREVPCADGGINMSVLTGTAGLVGNPSAVLNFFTQHSIETGRPLSEQWFSEHRTGFLEHGTAAFAGRIHDGYVYVALFNSDSERRGVAQANIRSALQTVEL